MAAGFGSAPRQGSYDVVIIGGGIMGSAAAWFLARSGFDGRILVLERDPSYEFASTSLTNSCIRQQFSSEVNIRISQFGVQFLRNFRAEMGVEDAPEIHLDGFGYLYLAQDAAAEARLRRSHDLQRGLGVDVTLLTGPDLAARFPFIAAGDVLLASHGGPDEGYFDGGTMFDWWRRQARARGVEYVAAEAVALERAEGRIVAVTLGDGTRVAAGTVVNAAGPRAAQVAAMAGATLPVEPRKRFTFVFDAEDKLPAKLPLVIDPSGVHMRQDGALFMAGCGPLGPDDAVAPDDFTDQPDLWEERVWPTLAARVQAFERIRLRHSWVGHYAYNTLDQNAIVGFWPDCPNLILMNGFSGHGLQQSAAMGRGVSELITAGGYQTLDLSALGPARLLENRSEREFNVI